MFIVTHTLLPVCLGLGVESASLAGGRGHVFAPWGLAAIGLFGALPDLCSPHLSLAARYTSWSHTVWFLIGLLPVCAMLATFLSREGRWKTALACWLAALLHLASDAVAGGIAWRYPWSPEILGAYHIPSSQWLWYDIGFLALTVLLVRLRPLAEARGMKWMLSASSPDACRSGEGSDR